MRVLGLVATSLLLAVGATAALTLAPDGGGETATPQPASTAAPGPAGSAPARPRKPKFTPAQRRARAAAAATLREQGYRPVSLVDYDPTRVLRVLIGRGDGGQRAFFFAGGRYVGNDAADDSKRIRVARAGNRSIALSYRLFAAGDEPCCPSGGSARVLFRWDGERLAPQTAVPPSTARRAPLG
jgi:LppP/LprE lipoprotein